jgi:hypothetical protein
LSISEAWLRCYRTHLAVRGLESHSKRNVLIPRSCLQCLKGSLARLQQHSQAGDSSLWVSVLESLPPSTLITNHRVKVVVVITGGVQSRIARVDRHLPPDSLYLPINEGYQRRVKHSQESAMPNDAYARAVVNHVIKRNPYSWIWKGNQSYLVWFLDTFFPREIWVSAVKV